MITNILDFVLRPNLKPYDQIRASLGVHRLSFPEKFFIYNILARYLFWPEKRKNLGFMPVSIGTLNWAAFFVGGGSAINIFRDIHIKLLPEPSSRDTRSINPHVKHLYYCRLTG